VGVRRDVRTILAAACAPLAACTPTGASGVFSDASDQQLGDALLAATGRLGEALRTELELGVMYHAAADGCPVETVVDQRVSWDAGEGCATSNGRWYGGSAWSEAGYPTWDAPTFDFGAAVLVTEGGPEDATYDGTSSANGATVTEELSISTGDRTASASLTLTCDGAWCTAADGSTASVSGLGSFEVRGSWDWPALMSGSLELVADEVLALEVTDGCAQADLNGETRTVCAVY
jgi:hypothetical protein